MKKIVLFAVLAASTPGVASADSGKAGASGDGQRMICRPVKETGSRLSKKRVCMTRDQWAEQKRIMRTDLNAAQTRRNEPQGQ